MKAFDLEKALAGEPVRDLSGNKRYILKHPENGYLVTYAMDNIAVCCSTIWYKNINQDEFSMFGMYEEPRPTVTLTLPCPLLEPRKEMHWFDAYGVYKESMNGMSDEFLKSGRYFATEEDARAWLDAMRNARK